MRSVTVSLPSALWPDTSETRLSGSTRLRQRCGGFGLDVGEYAAKYHLQLYEKGVRGEVPSRDRSVSSVLDAVMVEIEDSLDTLTGIDCLFVSVRSGEDVIEELCERLRRLLPSVRVAPAELEDPRTAPWYAVETSKPGLLWVLDVGWKEVRLHALDGDVNGVQLRRSTSQSRYHGRLIDKGILMTLSEFDIVPDAEEAYADVDGAPYTDALILKERLSAGSSQPISVGPHILVKPRVFFQDLFKTTAWRNFPNGVVDKAAREALVEEGGRLVFGGGSCRLPGLVDELNRRLKKQLRVVTDLGDDAGHLWALGLAVYSLRAAVASLGASEPMAAIDHGDAAEADAWSDPKPTEVQTSVAGRLMLRMEGELRPMFSVSDGRVVPETIMCHPVPAFLADGGSPRLELQCFLSDEGGNAVCPYFVGRKNIEVPTREGGFSLTFQLIEQDPLRLQVEVAPSDGSPGVIAWHVGDPGVE